MTEPTKKAQLDKRVMQFISADKDGISVDWNALVNFRAQHSYPGRHISEGVCDGLVDFLKQAGVLVYSGAKGSYAIIGEGVLGGNIGPLYSVAGVNFNFTTQIQAERYKEFAGRFHGEAVLPAHIVQVID